MVVTFPHMGSLDIVLSTILAGCGAEVLSPPPLSKATLELGVKYAPEMACLPFKLSLGNFIQALRQGADTIVTCGGEGPCRLGYYAVVQKEILCDLGFEFEMVVVEPSAVSVWRALKRMTAGRSWRRIARSFLLAGAKLNALDVIERTICRYRPRLADPRRADLLRAQTLVEVARVETGPSIAQILTNLRRDLATEPTDRTVAPLLIGLVGEIYVMLEPFVNQDLLRRLGCLGVEVYPTLLLGDYVHTHIFKSRAAVARNRTVGVLAAPYLGCPVGGHGQKSIGYTARLGRQTFDGVIQVLPFACMPEVIASNILPAVSRAEGIPVLSLTFDEQTGAAGVLTRLEAFVDLLRYRRRTAHIAATVDVPV